MISNPKKLKFVELDPAQTARSLPDLDVSAVNGNYAFLAGIMGSGKAILYEKPLRFISITSLCAKRTEMLPG